MSGALRRHRGRGKAVSASDGSSMSPSVSSAISCFVSTKGTRPGKRQSGAEAAVGDTVGGRSTEIQTAISNVEV